MDTLLPEIPRLHTALAEWAACMVFILIFKNQMSRTKRILLSGFALAVQCTVQIIAGMVPVYFWIPGMVSAVLFMFLWIYLLCGFTVYDAAYTCVRAFVLAEFVASLEWQIYCFFIYSQKQLPHLFWGILNMVMVYGLLFFMAFVLERRFYEGERRLGIKMRELCAALVIGAAAFAMSNLGFAYSNTLFSARFDVEMFIVRTTMTFGGLAVLYTHYILGSELRAEKELDAIRNILQRQYSQYELFQENMNLLNMKHHDLKHQIDIIRAEKNTEKREAFIAGMEDILAVYESKNRTGNQVLDTILNGKKLVCAEYGIELTSVINGKLLDFMDVMDTCTIFGNALDNAIECEKQIEEKEKRMIHVSVFSKNNFLMIRFENYFTGTLINMVKGIPETTKTDKKYHGYGLKSIHYSAKKYGGTVTTGKQGDWFELKILIPRG